MKDLMGRARLEGTKVEGTPISTVTTIELLPAPSSRSSRPTATSSRNPAAAWRHAGEQDDEEEAGRRRRHRERRQEPLAFMTTTIDVLSVATTVGADAVSIPAGFKEK